MAKKTYKGRPLLPGDLQGEALVSKQPFNTTGSYLENMFMGRTDAAPCTDADNPELYQKDLANCILITPSTIGSTLGGAAIMGRRGGGRRPQGDALHRSPRLRRRLCLFMEDIWNDKRVITIDMLGDEMLENVKTGDPITIHADGTVEIG